MAGTIGNLPRVFIDPPNENYVLNRDWRPWPTLDAVGSVYLMRTPGNHVIRVFKRSNSTGTSEKLDYFCHGWSFGTYLPGVGGYSIVGEDARTVLEDGTMMENLANDALTETKSTLVLPADKIRAGDVVAWIGSKAIEKRQADGTMRFQILPVCWHTAIIRNPIKEKGTQNLSLNTQMSSKNGPQPLNQSTTLRELMGEYRSYKLEWNGKNSLEFSNILVCRRRTITAVDFPGCNESIPYTVLSTLPQPPAVNPAKPASQRVTTPPSPPSQRKPEVKSVL